MNTWIMHVKNFGKIKSADIEAAPMTLFVGDNNSGKSYIMTLLYGLINVDFYYGQYQFDKQSENFKKCMKFMDRIYGNADRAFKNIEMTYEEMKDFEGVLNEVLSINRDKFIRELFNKQIDIGSLELTFKEDNKYAFTYDLNPSSDGSRLIFLSEAHYRNNDSSYHGCLIKYKEGVSEYDEMISCIIKSMIMGNFGINSIYFPTARTGYVLTYKSLVGSALKDKFNLSTMPKNLLTKPNSDFLTKLSQITDRRFKDEHMASATQAAVSIIEENIIEGKVSVSDMPAPDILYRPHGTETQLPMFVSSGVVTEMTPLVLFFKNETVQTVLIEEPEISLHLKLQREMGRVLVRLANSEIPVFVTTHSDIILQHINNMIKLAKSPKREMIAEKLGYEGIDWIDKSKVNVYQFDVDSNQKTAVKKLPCGDFGFEVMTFYNTLEELNRQIDLIEEE